MQNTNQWNELVDIFGHTGNDDQIPETAADNILIAWPSIIKGIQQAWPDTHDLAALDYGCGGGLFCRRLHSMGFQVTGYDPSEALIKSAQGHVPPDIRISNDTRVFATDQQYALLTSIMVLQFIDNIEEVIASLCKTLDQNGILIYAVFNPAFVYDNMGEDQMFVPSNRQDVAYMELKPGVRIPFYIRSDEDYRSLFKKYGMQETYHDMPPFTAGFIEQYGVSFSTQHAEFLIQAFRFQS